LWQPRRRSGNPETVSFIFPTGADRQNWIIAVLATTVIPCCSRSR
jgi:hypothetical protein